MGDPPNRMTSTPWSSFADVAGRFLSRVEDALDRSTPAHPDCPPALCEAMRYSLLAGGKRLRPLLVLLAAEACGAAPAAALPAACAVEMVHTYSLIHDDLPAMDDDDLRRGRASCHRQFGEAVAILAGDALLARAFEILAREVRPPAVAAACCAALAAAAGPTALVGGQVDDVRGTPGEDELARLEAIHRRKTGAMIRVSLTLGALVARAEAAQRAALDRYGRRLGLAFQIVDDLLDLEGDESAMGKRGGKDAARGKVTFPGVLGAPQSRARAARLVAEACDALLPLGERGQDLQALARYVLERNR